MKRSFLMTGLPLSLIFGLTSSGDATGDPVKLWNAVRSAISSLYSAVVSLF
jgi:hypothetical protein